MRYLVLTDIHANLEALEACVTDAAARGFDRSLVLGDIVGYGADPNAVIERVQALHPAAVVRGNHDKAACGIDQAEDFNAIAKRAVDWTSDALTPAHLAWLTALPQGPHNVDELIEVCHGSPCDEDEYVVDEIDALRALVEAARPLCLFGHTHYPVAFELKGEAIESAAPSMFPEMQMRLVEGSRYLVNPGSVGQPRDGDPRAAYAIVDSDARRVEWFRVPYAVERTQAKMLNAGLPDMLAHRLGFGR